MSLSKAYDPTAGKIIDRMTYFPVGAGFKPARAGRAQETESFTEHAAHSGPDRALLKSSVDSWIKEMNSVKQNA